MTNWAGTFPDDGSDPALQPYTAGQKAELRLLGGFSLRWRRQVVELTHDSERLLALLALTGTVPRPRAAAVLWPDSSHHHGLASLRTAVWRTNRMVPGMIEGRRGYLGLTPRVTVDVHCLPGTCDDLLPDWDDDWLAVERERWHQRRLHLMEQRARAHVAARDFAAALDVALTALALDPLRESAHQVVIEVHRAEGNWSEAFRAFKRCADVLARELGVRPSPSTCALIRTDGRG